VGKKFLSNIAFVLLLNLIIKPFWFLGIEVSVQNHVSNAVYGNYFSLLSFSMIFNILLDFGITNFNNREIARNGNMLSKYFSNIFILKLLLGIIYLIICLSAGLVFGYTWAQMTILLILAVNQFLASFIMYLRSNINGLLMFVTDSIISVLDKTLMIIFLSILLWTSITKLQFKIEWFIYSQTISYIITATIALIIVIKKSDYFLPGFNYNYLYLMLKKSIPFSVLAMLMFLYNRMEPILLERLLPDGKTQAGIYAQGYRIMDVLSNFILLFPVLLLPLFSKILKHNRSEISNLINLAGPLMIIPAIIIASVCSAYGSDIMNLLYHQPSSGKIFSLLIIGFIGITFTYLYGTLLTANGSLKQLNIMALSTVVLNFSLNMILIPHFKAQGAAISSFVSQSTAAIIQIILAYKIIEIVISKIEIVRLITWIVLFYAVLIISKTFIPCWQLGLTVISLTGIIMALLLKLINIKEIIRTLFVEEELK
jgi:O-antigen/teichoic acid export membrane protein